MHGTRLAEVWLESSTGERIPIRGRCFLGRSAGCQVVLADAKVSRQHALVQGQDQTEFWVIDMGSANGTYLNARRVTQPSRLFDGDRIEVAGYTFVFHGPKAPAAGPSERPATDATIHEIRSLMCWLLLADLEGSTELLRRMPADLAPRLMGRWLAACREILDDHQGTINKYLGDGFLAYWAAGPEAAASVAQSLVALKRLQEQAETRFRVVVHYGKVNAGGGPSLGEESLAGNEVNFIFRAEKLAASINEPRLLSQTARAELEPLLPTRAAGRHAVPGFDGPFSFFSF